MSIPLDRLYHYLESLSNDDILIYRWNPHGSKKLEHLTSLHNLDHLDNLTKFVNPVVICHDQEPLNYALYTHDQCLSIIKRIIEANQHRQAEIAWYSNQEFLSNLANTKFRVMLDAVLNLNDNLLLCHSEKNSAELALYENNNYIGVYYWCHALIARDWFRFAEHDPQLKIDPECIKYDFLVYNRAWTGTREYRLKFIELLVNCNLQNFTKTTFSSIDDQQVYTNYKFANPNLKIHRTDLHSLLEPNTASSNASADFEAHDYKQCAIEVVLETLFDDCRWHLTEKSLRPIACGRPFMLTATPGSLEYLRSYGFKTFNGLIDEAYDTIHDPVERLTAIIQEMHRISSLGRDSKIELWRELYKIADYNKQHFFSPGFHNYVIKEFSENLHSGLEKCKISKSGSWWKSANNLNKLQGLRTTLMTTKIECFLKDYNTTSTR